LLHGVVGVAHNAAAEEKPLDVIAPVECDGQFGQFPGRESGARDVAGAAVYAIRAVVDAKVAHKHFKQGDAPPIGGKAVADAPGHGVAKPPFFTRPVHPAGCAGDVVFCAVR